MSTKTNCEKKNITKLNICESVKAKKQCEKNQKNVLKKINNSKSNTLYKKIIHTFFYQKNIKDNLKKQSKEISNITDKLNNKINPKYKLSYINDRSYYTINMHIIDFFNNRYLVNIISNFSNYIIRKNININRRNPQKIIYYKNKILLEYIIDEIITLELYNLLLFIFKNIYESFHNQSTNYLFKINNETRTIIINYQGMQLFYSKLSEIYRNTQSDIIKFIIDCIVYYIDNKYRHRNDPKQFILEESIDNIKLLLKIYPNLPNPITDIFMTGFKTNIKEFIKNHINNKNNGSFINMNNLNFWTEIPLLFSKMMIDLTINKIVSPYIK